jgi:hypothetical protein
MSSWTIVGILRSKYHKQSTIENNIINFLIYVMVLSILVYLSILKSDILLLIYNILYNIIIYLKIIIMLYTTRCDFIAIKSHLEACYGIHETCHHLEGNVPSCDYHR